MKFEQLMEAAGAVIALPFDDDLNGDSMWGITGFKPNSKPIEQQVISFIKAEFGADDEELKDWLSELRSVLFVPQKEFSMIMKAIHKAEIHSDSGAIAVNSFIKTYFVMIATKKQPLNFKGYINEK